eukprot:SAG11_NODE_630_length_8069_cov_2.158344_7_plen_142_part_00
MLENTLDGEDSDANAAFAEDSICSKDNKEVMQYHGVDPPSAKRWKTMDATQNIGDTVLPAAVEKASATMSTLLDETSQPGTWEMSGLEDTVESIVTDDLELAPLAPNVSGSEFSLLPSLSGSYAAGPETMAVSDTAVPSAL